VFFHVVSFIHHICMLEAMCAWDTCGRAKLRHTRQSCLVLLCIQPAAAPRLQSPPATQCYQSFCYQIQAECGRRMARDRVDIILRVVSLPTVSAAVDT
jgi:hypothetical protein